MPFFLPLVAGAAALTAGGVGGARVLKDELDMGVDAAAREELAQGKRKGYKTDGGGEIQRGLFEKLRDFTMGNDRDAIRDRARELHVEKLQANNPEFRSLNRQLTNLGEEERIAIGAGTTQEALTEQIGKIQGALPYLQGIDAAGGDRDGLSVNTNLGTLAGALDDAREEKKEERYVKSTAYQDQKAQQNLQNTIALGQMNMAEQRLSNEMQIAQMNNQLQMRRQDSADRRADRRDRQAAIQQLMAGLSTFGASIAI